MVAHCFKVISKVVKELNPQQPPVNAADQPVYCKTSAIVSLFYLYFIYS